MIHPISFIWKQFTGSQVLAFLNGLFTYFKETYDANLEYFRHLSIANANDSHLTFIGILQNIARPHIVLPNSENFLFSSIWSYTDDPDNPGHRIPSTGYPSDVGFAEVGGSLGGRLAEVDEFFEGVSNLISPRVLRGLLNANAKSSGYLGSLVALDDIIYSQILGTTIPYEFRFITANDTEKNYAAGDCIVDLHSINSYISPLELFLEIQIFGKTIYAPVPRIVPELEIQ